jgi:hypothetical protein
MQNAPRFSVARFFLPRSPINSENAAGKRPHPGRKRGRERFLIANPDWYL